MKTGILFIYFISIALTVTGQILEVIPSQPVTTSDVTIVFDATKGNGVLAGYNGDVYAHTGLITSESQNGNDWKHVIGDWGTADERVLMTRIGTDLYQINYNIRDFYDVDPEQEQVLELAFVFRNENGSLVGRRKDGNDIFYPINIFGAGDYLSHHLSDDSLIILTTKGELDIIPFTSSIIRLSFLYQNNIPSDTSYTVILQPQHPDFTVEDHPGFLQLGTDSLKLVIGKFPVSTDFYKLEQLITSEETGFYDQEGRKGIRMQIVEGEQLGGTGSRAVPVNRNGYRFLNYGQAHYGYGYGEQNLNISIPLVTSSKGYALFFDNPASGTFDLGNTSPGVLDFSSESGQMIYFFIRGDSYDDQLKNYTRLTGRHPLPPLWSLGYFQSRFGYENENHARTMVNDMQAGGFPLDVIVLDLYWFGDPSTMGNLEWDYGRWPNPEGMISDFKEVGVKTILITEPYFTLNSTHYNFISQNHWFGNTPSGETYVLDNFWAGTASLMDFTKPETLDWMWNYYKARKEEGVAGWWSDLGEPELHPDDMVHKGGTARQVHNLLSLLWAQSLYKHYQTDYPGERVFNLIRSGYAGMQRYATFPWSGDVQKTWEGFQAQVPIMLGMGMSGVGYMGSDIGGFVGDLNEELYTRWMQFGVFSPVMRAHGVNVITEPVYLPEPYQSIVKKYILLRYQMLPYNYSLAWQNTTTGRPLALPMDYFEPENTFLNNINDQYFWGENLLVAPVLEEGQTNRSVILPSGKWIDFTTNKTFSGERIANVSAVLDQIPVFAKAGSFIPLAIPKTSTGYFTSDTLLVWYYPDKSDPNTSFTVYLDDGHSAGALQQGEYALIHLSGQVGTDQMLVDIESEGNGFSGEPYSRQLLFEIKRVNNTPDAVLLDNKELSLVDNVFDYYNTEKAAYFDQEKHILMVHFIWTEEPVQLEITGTGVGVDETVAQPQHSFVLHAPYPNPFSTELHVQVDVGQPGNYSFAVYDVYGKLIRQQNLFIADKGRSWLHWNGRNVSGVPLPSGTYIVSLQREKGKITFRKVVLLRK